MADKIKLELTPDELKILALMAENELLRMKFVNPGYRVIRLTQKCFGRLSQLRLG